MLYILFLFLFLLFFGIVFNCWKSCSFTVQLYESCFSNKVIVQKCSWFVVAHEQQCQQQFMVVKILLFFSCFTCRTVFRRKSSNKSRPTHFRVSEPRCTDWQLRQRLWDGVCSRQTFSCSRIDFVNMNPRAQFQISNRTFIQCWLIKK